jgi:hypothetical protein
MIANIGGRLSTKDIERIKELVNIAENPIKYLGIDPGKKNGVCGYGADYALKFMLTIDANDINIFLHQFGLVKLCVIEGYKLYPNKMQHQIYSSMETSRVIGRVESWAENNKIELVVQGASIKKTGYAWIGRKPLPKNNPMNHSLDAHVHFMHWAIKNNRISAEEILKKGILD